MKTLGNYVLWGWRIILLLISLYGITPVCFGQDKRATAKGWDRDFLEDEPDLNDRRLFLAILSSIDDRLIGYFVFHNASLGTIILHGSRTAGAEFWPVIKMEVQSTAFNEWITIFSIANPQSFGELTVQPNERIKLMVAMDAFRPFLGKYKLGRIILENGDTAGFELNNLLPPKSQKRPED